MKVRAHVESSQSNKLAAAEKNDIQLGKNELNVTLTLSGEAVTASEHLKNSINLYVPGVLDMLLMSNSCVCVSIYDLVKYQLLAFCLTHRTI